LRGGRRRKFSPNTAMFGGPAIAKNIMCARMHNFKSKIPKKNSPQTGPAIMFSLGPAVALDVPVHKRLN